MRYYLGLDNGGTSTKAALFTTDGKEVACVGIPTATYVPKPGFAERDMEEMWQANCTVIRQVIEKSGVAPEQVVGIGVCGHGKGLYLWGKDNHPVRRGIPSTDNRAYSYPQLWQRDGTEKKAFALSCQHTMACQPVALLSWLRDNEPENYGNICWVFECKDYIRFRLTGEARAELTDYSGTGLLNLHTRRYDSELLQIFGLEAIENALPPLCLSTEISGYITEEAAVLCGLAPGTPVVGGMFDINACALAVGMTDEDKLCVIAGTWSINEYLRKTPVIDGSVRMNSLFCLPEYYLIEESSPTSVGNSEWFLRQLLPELMKEAEADGWDLYAQTSRWVDEIPVKTFVPVFLPFLMASNVHPNARAAFIGLNAGHTRKHLLRSIYEGVVYCHRVHIEKLLRSREEPPSCIRLAGGAAKSPVWTQMFADILQFPIETVNVTETGALGCAIAVSVAVGDYESLTEAAIHMCEVSEPVFPRPEAAAIYEKKYALYQKTIQCLDGVWDEMQALIEENYDVE